VSAHISEDRDPSTIENNITSTQKNSEILSREDISHEFIMLSLRTVRGIDLTLAEQYIVDMKEFLEKASELVAGGELLKIDNHLRIPADKLFISDNIIREFF
jgi:coproporphyrinogen III oxidase-like Fe-S oxidoreductase